MKKSNTNPSRDTARKSTTTVVPRAEKEFLDLAHFDVVACFAGRFEFSLELLDPQTTIRSFAILGGAGIKLSDQALNRSDFGLVAGRARLVEFPLGLFDSSCGSAVVSSLTSGRGNPI